MNSYIYTLQSFVGVCSFVRQPDLDGENIIIGNLASSNFVVLSVAAVELLDWLAEGKMADHARWLYCEKFGEEPDILDFLNIMDELGFLYPLAPDDHASRITLTSIEPILAKTSQSQPPTSANLLLLWKNKASTILTSQLILWASIVVISIAFLVLGFNNSLWPSSQTLVFTTHSTVLSLSLFLLTWLSVYLHEVAHWLSARRLGIHARLGLSRRMWMVVAETDITNIWSIPPATRYRVFLAGPLLDLVSAAFLIIGLYVFQHSVILARLTPLLFQLGQALLLTYIFRIVWQGFLFVRTDFYYIIVNFFNCKNLLKDSEAYLSNRLGQLLPWLKLEKFDQSMLSAREFKVIKWYALVYLSGRVFAIYILFSITLPILKGYFLMILITLARGWVVDPYKFLDNLVLGIVIVLVDLVGLSLWVYSLLHKVRTLILKIISGKGKTYEI